MTESRQAAESDVVDHAELQRRLSRVTALVEEWERDAEKETAEIGFRKFHHRDWPKITALRAAVEGGSA